MSKVSKGAKNAMNSQLREVYSMAGDFDTQGYTVYVVTVAEAAKHWQVNRKSIEQAILRGKLKFRLADQSQRDESSKKSQVYLIDCDSLYALWGDPNDPSYVKPGERRRAAQPEAEEFDPTHEDLPVVP